MANMQSIFEEWIGAFTENSVAEDERSTDMSIGASTDPKSIDYFKWYIRQGFYYHPDGKGFTNEEIDIILKMIQIKQMDIIIQALRSKSE